MKKWAALSPNAALKIHLPGPINMVGSPFGEVKYLPCKVCGIAISGALLPVAGRMQDSQAREYNAGHASAPRRRRT
ncbi:MAG TPA: hypothetical protein VIG89_04380, partial [Candidatus Acidoferrales bacterium]